jgi:hypothetical protein
MTERPSVGPMLATFLALILTVLSIALPAAAEQPATIPTIGWLVFEAGEGGLDGFRQGLRELGYIEGQNIAIEARPPDASPRPLLNGEHACSAAIYPPRNLRKPRPPESKQRWWT